MKKTLPPIVVLLLLIITTGCIGPRTKSVYRRSLRYDPLPSKYIVAWKTSTHIYVQYELNEPKTWAQEVLNTNYWARIERSSMMNTGWRIYRKDPPPDLMNLSITPIEIIDISGFKKPKNRTFLNTDQYLTYIIDSNNYELPVLLINSKSFYLTGSYKLHGSYRGQWNPPQGKYRDKSTIVLHSWKYPFTMIFDFIFFPADKFWESVWDW